MHSLVQKEKRNKQLALSVPLASSLLLVAHCAWTAHKRDGGTGRGLGPVRVAAVPLSQGRLGWRIAPILGPSDRPILWAVSAPPLQVISRSALPIVGQRAHCNSYCSELRLFAS